MVAISRVAAGLTAIAVAVAFPSPSRVQDLDQREADFELHSNFSSLANLHRRQSLNYNQDYTTGGTVNFSPSGNGFTLNYNVQQDFVVGRGWTTGDSTPITYSGTFTPTGGVGLLSIYGWTTNPLVEYYIMESNQNYPTQGTQKGTVTSDGGTYEIWEHQQTNQPSILGTSTFQQYISVRTSGRSSGTVTLENHFKAWAAQGMDLGTFNYQVLAVESWSGSGSASQTISKGSGSSSTGPSGSSSSTAPASTPSSGGGSSSGSGGAAEWGQCGGTGWQGATTCASPYTCHYINSYYSQCY